MKIKRWFKRQWAKFKTWIISVAVALGLLAGAAVAAVDFTYTRATQYEDGTPLPLDEIAETRLYCGDVMVASEAGADGDFMDVVLTPGTYDCYATHVATNGLESQPSNIVQKTWFSLSPPGSPELDP